MLTTGQVALRLRKHGFNVLRAIDSTLEADGEVDVHEKVHVQVGNGYLCVVRELPGEKFQFGPNHRGVTVALVAELNTAIVCADAELGATILFDELPLSAMFTCPVIPDAVGVMVKLSLSGARSVSGSHHVAFSGSEPCVLTQSGDGPTSIGPITREFVESLRTSTNPREREIYAKAKEYCKHASIVGLTVQQWREVQQIRRTA